MNKSEKQEQNPINLEVLDTLRLDNIIPIRNQYSNLRYEVISESLFFENKKLIEDACNILELHTEALKQTPASQDYVSVAAQRFCSELNQFSYRTMIPKQKLIQQQEQQKSVLPTHELIQMIQDNLADGDFKYMQSKATAVAEGLVQARCIVIEFTSNEFSEFRDLPNKLSKDNYVLEQVKDRLIMFFFHEFWNNNNFLLQKYQAEIQQILSEEKQLILEDKLLILVKGKEIKTIDYLFQLEKEFFIEDNKLELADHGFQKQQTFKPLYECSILHSNQKMINCIQMLKSLERQTKFARIKSNLVNYFGEQNSFQNFQHLLRVLEHAKQIIKWENLLKTFCLNGKGQQRLTKTCIDKKSNSNIQYIQQTLNASYEQLQPRFRHKFYNFAYEEQIQAFVDQPIQAFLNDYSLGNCAYQVFSEGLIVYFKLLNMQGEQRSFYSMLHYYPPPTLQFKPDSETKTETKSQTNHQTNPQNNTLINQANSKTNSPPILTEKGDLGQLILSDIDDGIQVIKYNFAIKEQKIRNSLMIYLHENGISPEIKQLIEEQEFSNTSILLKIVAVKTIRLFLNPKTRDDKVPYLQEV